MIYKDSRGIKALKGTQNMKKLKRDFRGGFSEGVANSCSWSRNAYSSIAHGYLGSSVRTRRLDQVVEEELRKQGLEYEGIGGWITSENALRMMDDMPREECAIRMRVRKYTADAFKHFTTRTQDNTKQRKYILDYLMNRRKGMIKRSEFTEKLKTMEFLSMLRLILKEVGYTERTIPDNVTSMMLAIYRELERRIGTAQMEKFNSFIKY
jgi:hypothetical protein